MADKVTVPVLAAMRKAGRQIVCVTAYDSTFGEIADEAGADVILVGDSLGNVVLGYSTTLPVTLDQMLHHTAATRSTVNRAMLVADLPFGSYHESTEQAVRSAVALMKAGAEAVKLEGDYADPIRAITKAGIPVFGHLGYTPQAAFQIGGPKIRGRGADGQELLDEAKSVSDAGAIGIVLELIPGDLAKLITESISAFTIGIGAGPHCSGQIQVLHDVLGLSPNHYRHSHRMVEGRKLFLDALRLYAEDVRNQKVGAPETAP
jgi:3-methyl-2-oxobutanoate hydroxymethyltransferase